MITITDDRGLAYDFAKRLRRERGLGWFTVKKLAEGAMITPASAQLQAAWFADLRVFECNTKIRPRSYRLMKPQLPHTEEIIRELENALEIILPRRREAARQEQEFFDQNKSAYHYRPGPGDRRRGGRSDNGGGPSHPHTSNGGPHSNSPAPSPNGHGTPLRAENNSTRNSHSANDNSGPSRPQRLTKGETLIEMLLSPGGASMKELQNVLGTKEHSIRAAISVETRKRGLRAVLESGRYRAEQSMAAAK